MTQQHSPAATSSRALSSPDALWTLVFHCNRHLHRIMLLRWCWDAANDVLQKVMRTKLLYWTQHALRLLTRIHQLKLVAMSYLISCHSYHSAYSHTHNCISVTQEDLICSIQNLEGVCDNKCAITLPGVPILENISTLGSNLCSIHFLWEMLYQHS